MMLAPNALLVIASTYHEFTVIHKHVELREDGIYTGWFPRMMSKSYEPVDKLPSKVYTYSRCDGILCPIEWETQLMWLVDAHEAMTSALNEVMSQALKTGELRVVSRKSMVNTLYKALVGG